MILGAAVCQGPLIQLDPFFFIDPILAWTFFFKCSGLCLDFNVSFSSKAVNERKMNDKCCLMSCDFLAIYLNLQNS